MALLSIVTTLRGERPRILFSMLLEESTSFRLESIQTCFCSVRSGGRKASWAWSRPLPSSGEVK